MDERERTYRIHIAIEDAIWEIAELHWPLLVTRERTKLTIFAAPLEEGELDFRGKAENRLHQSDGMRTTTFEMEWVGPFQMALDLDFAIPGVFQNRLFVRQYWPAVNE